MMHYGVCTYSDITIVMMLIHHVKHCKLECLEQIVSTALTGKYLASYSVCVCTCVCKCMCLCMYVLCMHVCVYVCVCLCLCVYGRAKTNNLNASE